MWECRWLTTLCRFQVLWQSDPEVCLQASIPPHSPPLWVLQGMEKDVDLIRCSYFIVADAAHRDVRSEAGDPGNPEEGHAQVPVLVRRVLLKSCRTCELMVSRDRLHLYYF